MKRRINIECYDEEISTAYAVEFVLGVIKKGRVSDGGNCFCRASTFNYVGIGTVAVEAKTNAVLEDGHLLSSDTFKVYIDREKR